MVYLRLLNSELQSISLCVCEEQGVISNYDIEMVISWKANGHLTNLGWRECLLRNDIEVFYCCIKITINLVALKNAKTTHLLSHSISRSEMNSQLNGSLFSVSQC